MTERSFDIALTQAEAGNDFDTVYENVCTLKTDKDLCFNYATAAQLRDWGFLEGCFSCLLRDKKDVIIQVITTYKHKDGANLAYNADVVYLKKNNYGKPLGARTFGEASILLGKKQSDGFTYNLLFLKDTVFAAISAKYKEDKPGNIEHILALAEKIAGKI